VSRHRDSSEELAPPECRSVDLIRVVLEYIRSRDDGDPATTETTSTPTRST
jgi:hypothetical protein